MNAEEKPDDARAQRNRLIYINHRLIELNQELKRLKGERQKLRAATAARKSGKPGGKS